MKSNGKSLSEIKTKSQQLFERKVLISINILTYLLKFTLKFTNYHLLVTS